MGKWQMGLFHPTDRGPITLLITIVGDLVWFDLVIRYLTYMITWIEDLGVEVCLTDRMIT